MPDIFLSYAREDEPKARVLATALEARGWSVWWDRRIPHGQDFNAYIQQQLDAARCIVVLWSKASLASRFVRDEATEGLDGRLVPALIEAVKQPLGFRQLHAADLSDWHGGAPHDEFDRLVGSIGAIVPSPAARSVQPGSVPPASEPVPGRPTPPLVNERPQAATPEPHSRSVTADTGSRSLRLQSLEGPSKVERTEQPPPTERGVTDTNRTVTAFLERLARSYQMFSRRARGILLAAVSLGIVMLAIAFWPGASVDPEQRVESGSTEPGGVSGSTKPGNDATVATTRPLFNPSVWNLPNDKLLGFIEIPAGTFSMGSDRSRDSPAQDNELTQHQVTLPAFFIGRYEVTVGQYQACVNDGGCRPGDRSALSGSDDLPVRNVSWAEALAYCGWLELKLRSSSATPTRLADALAPRRDGRGGRVTLPSEAEWEKAARGPDGRIYPWGDQIDPTKANYDEARRDGPTPVGSFPDGASPYGLLDVSGNVWEWTRSHFTPYPYRPDDGRENLTAADDIPRTVRGGSFLSEKRFVRAAYRARSDPPIVIRPDLVGFRVLVSPRP